MPTLNEQLQAAIVRRNVRLSRVGNGIARDAGQIIAATRNELRRETLELAETVQGRTLEGSRQKRALKRYNDNVQRLRADAWAEVRSLIVTESRQLTKDEAEFNRELYKSLLPALNINRPERAEVVDNLLKTPFDGYTLAQHIDGAARADIERIQGRAVVAANNTTTITGMANAVTGSPSLDGRDGVHKRAETAAARIIHTTVPHAQSVVRNAFLTANPHIITVEKFTATLDARTTPICQPLDGRTFPRGEGPMPPLHPRCRSIRIAYLGQGIANRAYDPSTEAILMRKFRDAGGGSAAEFEQFARRERRRNIGRVPDTVHYPEFLRAQSVEFQNEVLGAARARLFRSGKATLADFVSPSGQRLTLGELAAKGIQ